MSDASDIFEQLLYMMMMDEDFRKLNLNVEKLLKSGYAINSSGIAIDMDEIKKHLKKHGRRGITIPIYRINVELRYDLLKKQLEI